MLPSINGVQAPYSMEYLKNFYTEAGEKAMAGMPKGLAAMRPSLEVPAEAIAKKSTLENAKDSFVSMGSKVKEGLKTPQGKIIAAVVALLAVVGGVIAAVKNNEVKESKAEEPKLYALA